MDSLSGISIGACLLTAALGYLLGNFQTAILLSKYKFHDDVRNHGSGNAGSTNMVRVFGLKPGLVTFAGDCLKAVLSILAGRLLMGEVGGYIAGFFTVLGHCYPAFAGLRGGKGVACSLAIMWMVFPLGAAIASAIALAVFFLTKRISVVSLSGILAFCISAAALNSENLPLMILAVLLTLLVYVRHIDNIKRILRGEEKQIIN